MPLRGRHSIHSSGGIRNRDFEFFRTFRPMRKFKGRSANVDHDDIATQYPQESTRSEESPHGAVELFPAGISSLDGRSRRHRIQGYSTKSGSLTSPGSVYDRGRNRRVSIIGLDASENRSLAELMTSDCINGPPPSGFFKRFIFRIRALPNRVLFRVARNDTRAVKQSLRLFPLSFREPDMEKRFLQSRRSTDHLRSWTVGLLCTSLVAMFWIAYTIGFSANSLETFLMVAKEWFHAGMAVALCGCLLFILVDILGARVPYGEGISLGFLSLVCIGPCAWILGTIGRNDLQLTPHAPEVVELLKFISLSTVRHHAYFLVMTSMFVVTLFAINTLLTIRCSLLVFAHICFVIVFTVCDVLNLTVSLSNAPSEIGDLGFFTMYKVSIVLEVIVFWITAFFALSAGLYKDLIDRVEFFRWISSLEMLEEIRARHDREPKGDGTTTIVEHITALLERAKDAVTEASQGSSPVAFVEGTDLLEKILQILRNSNNLYSLTTDAEQGEEGHQSSDRQIFQNQFLTVYGGKAPSPQMPQSRHSIISAEEGHRGDDWRQPRLSGNELNAYMGDLKLDLEGNVGTNIHFNILKYYTSLDSKILENVGWFLLRDSLQSLEAQPETLKHFLARLQSLYQSNPYHNSAHGAAVAHVMVCLIRDIECIKESREFNDVDYAVAVVAALGHDVAHPGRSNSYFVGKNDTIAVIWNDKSVLENFHSAVLCKILQESLCNVFGKFSYSRFLAVRERIIQLILATDMSLHFELMSRVKLRLGSPEFDPINIFDDVWMMVKQCLKAADLNHAFMPWEQHLQWSFRVTEEFYQQGDEEALRGLPVSPLCSRSELSDLPKGQAGFINFVVMPILEQLNVLPGYHSIEHNCIQVAFKNYLTWGSMVPQSDKEFQEKLLKDKETRQSLALSTRLASPRRFSSPRLSLRSLTEILGSRECINNAQTFSDCDDLPKNITLEIPKDIAQLKTNARPLWDVFVEVMSFTVPDHPPHLCLQAPKKAERSNAQATSLATTKEGIPNKAAVIGESIRPMSNTSTTDRRVTIKRKSVGHLA